mmetsp:Transcript_28706/g.67415  ORF Transcript_28706/g.67415 Transcript_28706/m.67415 type:complete len:244 (+) Transcript_28706:992-1723(+)
MICPPGVTKRLSRLRLLWWSSSFGRGLARFRLTLRAGLRSLGIRSMNGSFMMSSALGPSTSALAADVSHVKSRSGSVCDEVVASDPDAARETGISSSLISSTPCSFSAYLRKVWNSDGDRGVVKLASSSPPLPECSASCDDATSAALRPITLRAICSVRIRSAISASRLFPLTPSSPPSPPSFHEATNRSCNSLALSACVMLSKRRSSSVSSDSTSPVSLPVVASRIREGGLSGPRPPVASSL